MQNKKKAWIRLTKTILGVVLGNFILAFAVAAFFMSTDIMLGGGTGIALFLYQQHGINPSTTLLIFNAAMFLLGALVLGKKLISTTIVGTFLYPIFLAFLQKVPGITHLTDNVTISLLCAAVLAGCGIGLVIRVGSSTGGTDIIALVLHKWFHIPVAILMYGIDLAILLFQFVFATPETILYSLIVLAVQALAINQMQLLGKAQLQLFIVSRQYLQVKERILNELEAGATLVYIETGYDGSQQKGVLCIIPSRKLFAVTNMVQDMDPEAFITITQIKEVRGQGFSMERKMS